MLPRRSGRPSNRYEVFIGWTLARCVYPVAGWRSGKLPGRLAMLATYFLAGYATVFAALLLFV